MDQIENTLRFIIQEQNQKNVILLVHPYVDAFIKKGGFLRSRQWQWYFQYKQWIKVEGVSSQGILEFKFFNKDMDEIAV